MELAYTFIVIGESFIHARFIREYFFKGRMELA